MIVVEVRVSAVAVFVVIFAVVFVVIRVVFDYRGSPVFIVLTILLLMLLLMIQVILLLLLLIVLVFIIVLISTFRSVRGMLLLIIDAPVVVTMRIKPIVDVVGGFQIALI